MRLQGVLSVLLIAGSALPAGAGGIQSGDVLNILIRPDDIHIETLESEIVPVRRVFFHVVLHNVSAEPVELSWVRFDLVGSSGEVVSGQFSGEALMGLFDDSMVRRRIEPTPSGTLVLGPDERKAISDVFLVAPAGMVGETLSVESEFRQAESVSLARATVALKSQEAFPVRLPFEGIWYVAAGHGELDAHRRFVSEAFAYDFLRIGESGQSYTGQGTRNSDYLAYGQPVLAAADGEVVYMRNDIPENVPGQAMPATPGGNAIVIRHAADRYTYYAHMRPSGMRVGIGDMVAAGDVIGEVGNSGDSTEPHLHFHAMSGEDPGASPGIPVVFESWIARAYGRSAVLRRSGAIPRGDFVSAVPGATP